MFNNRVFVTLEGIALGLLFEIIPRMHGKQSSVKRVDVDSGPTVLFSSQKRERYSETLSNV